MTHGGPTSSKKWINRITIAKRSYGDGTLIVINNNNGREKKSFSDAVHMKE